MKKTYVYLIIVTLLVIIAVLAFMFVKTPEYKFAMDTSNSFKECSKAEYVFKPNAIAKAVINKDSNTILVDIRSKHEFINGHISNAKHIPKANILDDDNFDFFTDLKANNQKAILYGENVVDANIPFMILKQIGVENIGISCEGYSFFKDKDLNQIAITKSSNSNDETAIIDFAKYIIGENKKEAERIKLEEEELKKASKSKPVIKKRIIAKPKPTPAVEEEEEEGC